MKKRILSSLFAGIIMAAIAVALLWGGVTLISMGNIPLGIKVCNSFGFLLFIIGIIIIILMICLVGFDIIDPHILENGEKRNRIEENAEEENWLRSDWPAEPIDPIGFLLAFVYKKPIVMADINIVFI